MGERVSVILPVYNGATFVAEAIESVLSQSPDELIVVDDGSTDETAVMVQQYPVTYVYQCNQGAQHARNRGLSLAVGDILAFCDADDVWVADKLQRQQPLLATADIVIGYSQYLGSNAAPFLLPSLNCAMMRRSVFEQIGQFDPELPYSDDLDWYMRAREAAVPITVHDDVVLYHRRHQNNLTNNIGLRDHYQLMMLKKSLARRRAGQVAQPLEPFTDFLKRDK